MEVPQNLKITWFYLILPYDPEIPFMGMKIEKTKTKTDHCTLELIAAVFTIAKIMETI